MISSGKLNLVEAFVGTCSHFEKLVPDAPLGLEAPSIWRMDRYAHELIMQGRTWRAGEKVLDVGCGFSVLPRTLATMFGCEVTGVDDFGLGASANWKRDVDLEPFFAANTPASYIVELLGDGSNSKVPRRYY